MLICDAVSVTGGLEQSAGNPVFKDQADAFNGDPSEQTNQGLWNSVGILGRTTGFVAKT